MNAAERTIEQELDSLEAEALKGGEFVGITNGLALRFVRELRFERARNASLTDALRGMLDAYRRPDEDSIVEFSFEDPRVSMAARVLLSDPPAQETK